MNDNQYLVSICVPIFGVEKYIERCAISLFEQTYQNIEYIFVNDCTKDKSIEILHQTIKRYPNRMSQVRIIEHDSNKGLAGARNTAVNEATGDFIMHVDSDDYVDIDIVSKAIAKQKECNADIVIIDFIRAYHNFTQEVHYQSFINIKDYCLNVLSRISPNSIWAKLIRHSLYTQYNIKCLDNCNQGEDFQVVPKLLYHAESIVNLHELLYYYDCSNEGSYSNNFSKAKHEQNWKSMNIVRNYFINISTEYADAVMFGRVRQLVDDLIISVKTQNDISKYYYIFALNELSKIDHKYWKKTPIAKRVILYLSKNYILMKIYILTVRHLRHLILENKNKFCKIKK